MIKMKMFRDGQRERNKPLSEWNGTGIKISPPRSRRNRFQESRNDRLRRLTYTPDKNIRGKARVERQWFNDPKMVFVG
jgi:hypothetical protein